MKNRKLLISFSGFLSCALVAIGSTVHLGTYTISDVPLSEFNYPEGGGTVFNSTHQLVGAGNATEPPYNLTAPSFSLSDTSAFSLRLEAPAGQQFSLDFPTGTEFMVGGFLFFGTDGYSIDPGSELTNLFSNMSFDFVDASISVPSFDPQLSTRVGENGAYVQWMFGNGPGEIDSFTFSAIDVTVDFDGDAFVNAFGELGSLDYFYDTGRPFDNAFNLIGLREGEAPGAVLSITPIPEPSHYAGLFGLFALGFAVWRRKLRSRK